MVYTLQAPSGITWKIEDGDPSHRWTLRYKDPGGEWRMVATYTTPGAAVLAVAGGDTGVPAWDSQHHDVTEFYMPQWRRS